MSDNLTRTRILETARGLIKREGDAAAVTVGQVAAAARVSRATLYRYFPSKADLLQACGPPMADAKTHTTRERIIQATIQLVAERGLHASTLDAIAERAGISRSGLQWHYRNKDELIADVAKSVPALLTIAQMTDQPNANADCATQLHHVADVILGDAEIVRSVAPFLIVEMRQHAEVARLVSTHTLGPVLRHLIALFERHEQSGELRPGSAQARAQAFLGIVLSLLIVKPTFLTILLGDDATILHEQIDMLLHGILAHPQKDPA